MSSVNSVLAQVVEHYGGQYKLAAALDVSSVAVHHWIKSGALPPLRAIEIERQTGGRFKAVDLVDDEEQRA